MRVPLLLLVALVLSGFFSACASHDGSDDMRAEVVRTYADIVYASYEDSYDAAVVMDTALDAFLAEPSAATLDAAKEAWRDAREPYGQTEAYRFANGPIDDADGPESLINAWPLDEAYVDYVEGDPDAGIINNPETYPAIDTELLASLNERGAEENISTGFHAIEFLLWGQDFSETGPGDRPFTDYTTADHAKRRGQYLAAASELLVGNLRTMVEAWDPDTAGNYRETFLALDTDQAIRNMLTGIGTLSKSELPVERMFVAVNNQNQEDEHSCFSDNTNRDLITNAQGIANVWRGRYVRTDGSVVSGASLADLVEAADPEVAATVEANIQDALDDVNAVPVPFDRAIVNSQDTVMVAVTALQDLGDSFVEAARAIDVPINTALPT